MKKHLDLPTNYSNEELKVYLIAMSDYDSFDMFCVKRTLSDAENEVQKMKGIWLFELLIRFFFGDRDKMCVKYDFRILDDGFNIYECTERKVRNLKKDDECLET